MNSIVEEIRSRIDIVDLIAERVNLKQVGQNLKGLCPFHSEKTPSFTVSPSKQIFHCFGCNKGGDIFTFAMMAENMAFVEVLSYLSNKAGLELEYIRDGDKVKKGLKESLFAIAFEAMSFFQNNLRISTHALSYLKERGLSSETIERFSIGYSLNAKGSLFDHLKTKGFSLSHINASGLVRPSESPISFNESASLPQAQAQSGRGGYDFFRDRLMFPIFDLPGRVVAFGGRIKAPTKNAPKYINSPDSIIFKKGELSYGLNMAKSSIIQEGYSIIVEGYLDVIMCQQHGLCHTIAPLGTALTPEQLRKLKRFSSKVLLIFDGDSAGMSATKRSIELCYLEGIVAKILLLPEDEDPDAFIRKYGVEYFKKYMSRAISPVEFLLKVSSDKLDAVRYMLSLISTCPDLLQKDETIRELSDISQISEVTLREELKNISRKAMSRAKNNGRETKNHEQSSESSALAERRAASEEQILLNIALSMPEMADNITYQLDSKIIETPVILGIFEKIKALIDSSGFSIEKLLNICSDEEQKLITRLSINPEIDEDHVEETVEDCIRTINLKKLQRQINLASVAGDVATLHSLLMEKKKILAR